MRSSLSVSFASFKFWDPCLATPDIPRKILILMDLILTILSLKKRDDQLLTWPLKSLYYSVGLKMDRVKKKKMLESRPEDALVKLVKLVQLQRLWRL